MEAQNFKTKSFITSVKIPRILGNNQHISKSIVGIDGGYSSIKGVGQDRAFIFPSIIKRVSDVKLIGELKDTDIIMKDNTTGKLYYLGGLAYEQMSRADAGQLSDTQLTDRYWYQSEVYQVLMAAGIAMGLPDNYEKTDIYIQTGLPCEYADKDKTALTQVLTRPFDISLKVGNAAWRDYKFTPKGVFVMEQPQGTLFGMMYNSKGELIPERTKLLSGSTVILDDGYNTEDVYSITGGVNNFHETYTDTAMKSVFDMVLNDVNKALPREYQSFEIQKYLADGVIKYVDKSTRPLTEKTFEIGSLVHKYNEELCQRSIERLLTRCDDFVGVDTLVVTGGTNEARFEQIKDMLSGLSVEVLQGNINDRNLPFSFSNVIGYYMRAYNKLIRG